MVTISSNKGTRIMKFTCRTHVYLAYYQHSPRDARYYKVKVALPTSAGDERTLPYGGTHASLRSAQHWFFQAVRDSVYGRIASLASADHMDRLYARGNFDA